MSTNPLQRPPYGNIKVYHPDGTFMFYSDDGRCDFYLKNNLAAQLDEKSIQLKFIPGGYGVSQNPFYLKERQNICVVCGTDEKLTKHHVVPHCFRKHLPEKYKQNTSHDIVALCVNCHSDYEFYGNKLRDELVIKYDAEATVKEKYAKEIADCNMHNRVIGYCRCLHKYRNVIPPERIDYLEKKIEEFIGRKPTDQDLEEMAQSKCKETQLGQFRYILSEVDDLEEFFQLWRRHFVNTMKPKHLDQLWYDQYLRQTNEENS